MASPRGRFVFFFNHSKLPAQVDFQRVLEKPASAINEIVAGQKFPPTGINLELKAEVPAESVRIYRIDY
jgi:hypothetical protein